MAVMEWLLDSDPSIRWQVMRDLMDGPDEVVAAERSRIASEGWGARLLDLQAPDGHWGGGRSSFHTTICVLEGLLEYEKAKDATTAVRDARLRGQEYLLERGMFKSLSTGEVIDHAWTLFSFPTRWHYDVLWGLDYLRRAGVEPHQRVAEAVDLMEKKRVATGDGRSRNPTRSDPLRHGRRGR